MKTNYVAKAKNCRSFADTNEKHRQTLTRNSFSQVLYSHHSLYRNQRLSLKRRPEQRSGVNKTLSMVSCYGLFPTNHINFCGAKNFFPFQPFLR